jgi:hypothetical protein
MTIASRSVRSSTGGGKRSPEKNIVFHPAAIASGAGHCGGKVWNRIIFHTGNSMNNKRIYIHSTPPI